MRQYIRTHFEHRNKPCWACGMVHTKYMKVTEGPYTGYEGEEPEYEGMSGWGPQIGNKDPGGLRETLQCHRSARPGYQ